MNQRVTDAFTALVKSGETEFSGKVRKVVRALLDSESMWMSGEANDCFNPILTTCFNPLTHEFVGGRKDAHRAFCTAKVLLALAAYDRVGTQSNNAQHRLGWPALNRDAKGWCKAMLACAAPANISMAALRDLFHAKSIVWQLVSNDNNGDLLPMTDRDPLRQVQRSDIPDV